MYIRSRETVSRPLVWQLDLEIRHGLLPAHACLSLRLMLLWGASLHQVFCKQARWYCFHRPVRAWVLMHKGWTL